MKKLQCIVLIIATALLTTCSNSKFKTPLIGTWEWTGDKCNREGDCKSEIITDEQNRETFSKDGQYTSKYSKINYSLKGNSIYLGPDGEPYAEILAIKNGMMLLKFSDQIRRYNRIKP